MPLAVRLEIPLLGAEDRLELLVQAMALVRLLILAPVGVAVPLAVVAPVGVVAVRAVTSMPSLQHLHQLILIPLAPVGLEEPLEQVEEPGGQELLVKLLLWSSTNE